MNFKSDRYLFSYTEFVYQRFRELQLEPPTKPQVERLIKSAIAKYETDFAEQTLNKLTPEMTEQIDVLLSTEEMESDESVEQSDKKTKMSDFTAADEARVREIR
jgi:hypothetical protein